MIVKNMYLPYESISQKTDTTAYVPPELLEAQKQGKNLLPKNIVRDWDDWVAVKVGLTKEKLWEIFSSEQIDSIGLTIFNFEKGRGFIIADETGIGKGRILSGICRWAITHNKKIMFFTEREHLFSDFWRDLTDTETLPLLSNPTVFHSNSKVFNPDGELVLRGTTKIVKDIQQKGFPDNSNFVMTNYSQISLKDHQKTKYDVMLKFCKDNLIILDESHNATGDSNTKKFLLNLSEQASNMLFSSATFIKDESQLDIYEKVIDFDAETIKLLKKLLSNDQELVLRKIFTYELTRKLQFWRREHQPLNVGWKSIVCDNDELQSQYLNQYSAIINGLFELVNALSKEPALSELNLTNSWFSLGATINRLSRNLLLLFKVDTLVEGVKDSIARNHKAVVVVDSTFASIINKVISNQTVSEEENIYDDDENIQLDLLLKNDNEKQAKEKTKVIKSKKKNEEINESHINTIKNEIDSPSDVIEDKQEIVDEPLYELNFKQVLYYIIEEVAGKIIKEYEFLINDYLKEEYEALKLKAEIFQPLNISPIDMIIHQLAKAGIACNEISGRTFHVTPEGKIAKLNKLPKSKLVSEFNGGLKDVIIITRAGASGLSLHASAAFKDQRIRDLFELEITNRPTYRLQFIGRVNRKNQVVQPEFYTIVTKLPFEQRILNVEQQKLKRLQSHISGDDEKLEQENIHNFYTKYCDQCAYIFLKNHPLLAFQMGISLRSQKEELYYIDSVLKRCIVLNSEQQNFLYDYLIYCTECERHLKVNDNIPVTIEFESLKSYWHQLDRIGQEGFKTHFGLFPQTSINQFKYPWVGLMKIKSTYHTNNVFSPNLQKELSDNMLLSSQHDQHLKKVLNNYYIGKDYHKDYVSKSIAPLISKLHLGKGVTIKTLEGTIYGYIHNITYPKMNKAFQYDNLCLLHIKVMNPHLHQSIFYSPEDYYITLKSFVEADNITLHDQPIDWNKYNRPTKNYERINYCWVGHPVYMEFLRQSYQIGEVRYFDVGSRKNMCVMLPSSMTESSLFELKKPIYNANKIMELLISKEIKSLKTTWQDESVIKPTLKLLPTSAGYNLYIAKEIARDSKVIDYPLRKKLSNVKGTINGFEMFLIPYKDIRGVLLMLEKRDVIWFIN